MRSMKTILALATLFLVACAGAPSSATNPQVIEPVANQEPTESSAETAADRRFAEETRGYKLVERKGQKYYCRSERSSGSNIKAMSCFSENELRARVEQAEMYRRRSAVGVNAE
jgi:type IV pilus biogenesis protein CpaD/CtpE